MSEQIDDLINEFERFRDPNGHLFEIENIPIMRPTGLVPTDESAHLKGNLGKVLIKGPYPDIPVKIAVRE